MKGSLETVWCWPLRLGRKEEWKLQPSECNCLALSLPNTLRAYKHQWRGKGLISKDIKFSELCDLWENKAIWENYFLKLKSRLGEGGHEPRLSLLLKKFAHKLFLLDLEAGEKKRVAWLTLSPQLDTQARNDEILPEILNEWMTHLRRLRAFWLQRWENAAWLAHSILAAAFSVGAVVVFSKCPSQQSFHRDPWNCHGLMWVHSETAFSIPLRSQPYTNLTRIVFNSVSLHPNPFLWPTPSNNNSRGNSDSNSQLPLLL